MHGCNNQSKGCLLVTASRIGEGINAIAERIGNGIIPYATRIGEGLKVTCGLVCTVNESIKILEVQPDVIWLTPENGWSADINIISNVEWFIE